MKETVTSCQLYKYFEPLLAHCFGFCTVLHIYAGHCPCPLLVTWIGLETTELAGDGRDTLELDTNKVNDPVALRCCDV